MAFSKVRSARKVREVDCSDDPATEVVKAENNLYPPLPKCPAGSRPFHGSIKTYCLKPVG